MNENQKNFLNELDQMFKKYSISEVYIDDGDIVLDSHNERMRIYDYKGGLFRNVKCETHEYKPPE